MKICVIGAGICGMSSAYQLALTYKDCEITVVYDKCNPDTVSNHGFGMVSMQSSGGKYENMRFIPHAIETFKYCHKLYEQSQTLAKDMGIERVDGMHFVDAKNTLGEYKDLLCIWESKLLQENCSIDFSKCSDDELKPYRVRYKEFALPFTRDGVQPEDITGYKYSSYIIDCYKYLPWLKQQLMLMESSGTIKSAEFIQQKVVSLVDVSKHFDLVVNCSGLGAGALCNDEKMRPIRAQYVVLDPPVTDTFYDGVHTFTCPKPDRTLLGAIFVEGRNDDLVEEEETKSLLQRNAVFCPAVLDGNIKGVYTTSRPGRIGGPRVEIDWLKKTETPIIHNYGHGSKGFTLHWGCASEVVRLSQDIVRPKSHL